MWLDKLIDKKCRTIKIINSQTKNFNLNDQVQIILIAPPILNETFKKLKIVQRIHIQAAPNSLTVPNKSGETAQSHLDRGAKRVAEQRAQTKLEDEKLAQEENERETKCEERDAKRDQDEEFRQKLADEAEAEGVEGKNVLAVLQSFHGNQ